MAAGPSARSLDKSIVIPVPDEDLLVFNSLVFRVPLARTRYYAPLFLKLEAVIARVQRPWSSCFVVGQWRKR
jgi:hypothetical protein